MQCVYFVCVVIFRKIERVEAAGGGVWKVAHTHIVTGQHRQGKKGRLGWRWVDRGRASWGTLLLI